jgi:hypothetical protein
MADLQARIGPKAKKLYPNLTWKRTGAELKSPSKNTPKKSQTHRSHEKDDGSDASSYERASSPILSSPNNSRYRNSAPRPRDSSGQLSLLTRMGLSSEDGESVGKEEEDIQQLLLSRVGTTEDTPRSSPNVGSTKDSVHVLDSNHSVKSKHASLPSSSVCLFFFFCQIFCSNCFSLTRFRMFKETPLFLNNNLLTIDIITSRILIQIAAKQSAGMVWLSSRPLQNPIIKPFHKILQTPIIPQAT